MGRGACLSVKLPHGWKTIRAHSAYKPEDQIYYISPEGKRFATLKQVSFHIMENIGKNVKEMGKKIGIRRRRELLEEMKERDEEKLFEIRAKEIQKRRKIRSLKSPFRNLLRNVLKKMHGRDPFKKFENM